MPRRKPYSRVEKTNQIRAEHVKNMGDTAFKGFQCLNPECQQYIFAKERDLQEDFQIPCPSCGLVLESGSETKFYDYKMTVFVEGEEITASEGSFTIDHSDYLAESARYKYCIICNTLKLLDFFDRHSSRETGRQGECRLCKKSYNAIKNGTRLSDQHREAAQKRRLYLDLSGGQKIDSKQIYQRFGNKCFCCEKDLSQETAAKERPLDHTLPVYYLWALTTTNTTLLCRKCNGEKSGTWPSDFYSDAKLRNLSLITGIEYDLLAGKPVYNPEALDNLRNPNVVDSLLSKYIAYMPEVIKLRNRILKEIEFDIFEYSNTISEEWIRIANEQMR